MRHEMFASLQRWEDAVNGVKDRPMMNKDVKADINHFAGIIAEMQGMVVPHGYDFEESPNPNAVGCWKVAKASYNFWSLKFVRTPMKGTK